MILAKLEYFNPGNSIKDRIALQIVEDAEKSGLLKQGGTIIESTSGNTGVGLALIGISKGYKCIFALSEKQSQEKINILKSLGAKVVLCPSDVMPEDPRSYYSVGKRPIRRIPNAFYCNQYNNLSNQKAHYYSTGPEIWRQLMALSTHYLSSVGTGGTISGTGKYLKEKIRLSK